MTQHRTIHIAILAAAVCLLSGGSASAKNFLTKLKNYLDSSAVRGTDPAYIALPRKGWAVTYNTYADQMRLTANVVGRDNVLGSLTETEVDLKIRQKVSTSMGLWIGYRGYGAGYSLSLSGNEGTNLSVNMTGASYGLNARYYRFKHGDPLFSIVSMKVDGQPVNTEHMQDIAIELPNPLTVTSLVIDGYYIFNRKRFSYSAAYDQSVKQLRSAGSPIVGLMFYYQNYEPYIDTSVHLNSYANSGAGFLLSGGVTDFRVYQGSIGAGYTYNWVPARDWVVNITAMPVLTLLNRLTVHHYDTKETGSVEKGWIRYWLVDRGYESYGGWVKLNVDLRASLCYWHKDWFFTAVGQVHYFRGDYEVTTTKYFDWDTRVSIGFTF